MGNHQDKSVLEAYCETASSAGGLARVSQVGEASRQADQGWQPPWLGWGLTIGGGGRVPVNIRPWTQPASRWEYICYGLCPCEIAWRVTKTSKVKKATVAVSWLLLHCSEVLKVMKTRRSREPGARVSPRPAWVGSLIQVIRRFVKPKLLHSRSRKRIRVKIAGISSSEVSCRCIISTGGVFSRWSKAPRGIVSGGWSFPN